MRVISFSVNARRFDSAVDLSSFTRTAGLTASNPCRTASPRQIRSTSRPSFAVERESSFAPDHETRNVARLQRGKVAFDFDSSKNPTKRSITRL